MPSTYIKLTKYAINSQYCDVQTCVNSYPFLVKQIDQRKCHPYCITIKKTDIKKQLYC